MMRAYNYVAGAFARLGKSFNRFFLLVGYSRAIDELSRLGHHEGVRNLVLQREQLLAKTKLGELESGSLTHKGLL